MQDMKDSLRTVQEELCTKKEEVENLRVMLDQRQQELEERVALVNQLDETIKEQHREMEQRIQKLDANLRKHEAEIQERTKQIENLDDRLQESQSQLREKTLQLQQSEQLAQKLQLDLNSKSAKVSELQTLVDRQKMSLKEQKDENVEITQELRLTREQLQQQHTDFMATRRELAQSNRELEKLTRELDELRVIHESEQADTARLAEELGAAKAKEKDSESRKATEIKTLLEQYEDVERKYQSELSSLREEIGDYREANDVLRAQLKEKTKQLHELEQHYADQVHIAAQELDGINEEMQTRKLQMDASNEQLILKDSEIARLQAKVSGLERTLAAMRAAESFNSTPRDSDIGIKNYSMSPQKNGAKTREIILTDVSVSLPNNQVLRQSVEFGDEVEVHFTTENNNNDNRRKNSADQENIEPSGPVRVLNFSENEHKTGLHRPKPVLPNSKKPKDNAVSSSRSSRESSGDERQGKQSAFARVVKEKKQGSKDEQTLPGEKELEPITAMRFYNPSSFDIGEGNANPEQCMLVLQERLRANELRQQDIDRQLQSLEDDDVDT